MFPASRSRRRSSPGLAAALAAILLAGLLPAQPALGRTPEAVDDSMTVGVDSGTSPLDVLANDNGGPLTITAVTDPPNGTAAIDGSNIDYTPDAAFHGTDTFDYTVEDGAAATATATVTVVVDDPPVAVDDPGSACVLRTTAGGGFPVPEDYRRPSSGPGDLANHVILSGPCSPLANDTDPNGDPLTFEILTQPANGEVVKLDDGSLAYQPNPDYGTPPGSEQGQAWQFDTFTYRAFDGLSYSAPATVSLWVAAINDPPTFTPGAAVTVDEDGGPYSAPWTTAVSPGPANEADQAVTFEVTNLDISDAPGLFAADPAIAPDGTLTFTPAPDQHGVAHVTVRANDDGGLQDWGFQAGTFVAPRDTSGEVTFDIVVAPVEDPPVAGPDSILVARDGGPTPVPVLANDTDVDGDALSISGATVASHGTVAIAAGGTGLTYAPDAGYAGPDAFSYTVADGHGGFATGQVSVTVVVPNHPPTGTDTTVTTAEDQPYTVTVADLGFEDPDDTPPNALADVTISGLPASGSLLDDGAAVVAGQVIPAADIAAGKLTFRPAKDSFGPANAAFAFQVRDDGGTLVGGQDLDPTPNTITVDVTPVNDAPVANPDAATLAEDAPATTIDVLANDTDVDDPTTSLAVTAVTNGAKGTVAITDGGTGVTYQPNPNANGADTFTYEVSDPHGATATGTVSVTITPVNDKPNAANDAGLTVLEGPAPTALPVLANDTDIDGDHLTIIAKTNGSHGTVAILAGGAGLTYTPAPGYLGTDVFTYQVSDGHGGTDGATVLVTVVRDTLAPTVSSPAQGLPGQTVGLSTTTVRLSWSGSDAGTGIARYQLQVSVNGRAFTTVTLSSATATAYAQAIATGPTYRYRVRAIDRRGNVGAFRYGPTFQAGRAQESSGTVHFTGSWTLRTSSSMLGGHGRSATSTTSRVSFTTVASDIAWVATKTTSSGSAQVWLDGALVGTVNLRSTSTRYRQLVFTRHFTSPGRHTIQIRPIGGGRVDLDAFIALR